VKNQYHISAKLTNRLKINGTWYSHTTEGIDSIVGENNEDEDSNPVYKNILQRLFEKFTFLKRLQQLFPKLFNIVFW
jgi:hypothetical protein